MAEASLLMLPADLIARSSEFMADNITYRDAVVNTYRVSQKSRTVNNAGMAFKDNLRLFRKAAGLSQEALALACGWSGQSRIANYDKGIREPSIAAPHNR